MIAEGVEAGEQMRFLYALNCSEMQGFYFSKPLSATKFATLLRKPHWQNLSLPATAVH